MFGTPAAPASNPFSFSTPAAPTSSLFGAPAPATSLFGTPTAPTATTGGLFGSTAPAPAAPKFSFGAPALGATPPAPMFGGGLFGGAGSGATTTSPAMGLNLGGVKPSLFGQAAAPQPLALGASTATNGVNMGVTKNTKFNEAPDQYRNLIEGIDGFIRSQVQLSEELKARELGEEILKTRSQFETASADFTTVQTQLSLDSRLSVELKSKLQVDLHDLSQVTTMLESYANPSSRTSSGKAVANFPFEYFSRRSEEFKERMTRYKSIMDQIQHQLNSSSGLERNPAAIVPTLRAQHASFMSLASQVAMLDEELKRLRDEYRVLWRATTNSVQDPFAKTRAIERGVDAMEIR